MQTKLDFLIERVQKQNPQANIKKIRAAYECAAKAHEGQKRRNGEPYIIHPVAVAEIVVEMGLDTDSICAALLHDCIEDTEFGYKEIENKFGTPVAELVDGVTRLGMLRYSKEQEQFEDLRKMFLAMAKDIRVILIKLADRLHNARTFQFLPERKQRDKALETMEIYAPIAHRLGMSRIKWELEDLSLKVLDPIGYNEIVEGLKAQSEQHEEFLQGIQDRISTKLKEANIHNAISARVKHIYSIYRKMYAQHKTINEIYDICAVRVIVDTVADCYNVLGYVHDLYKPIPGRFKDYISTPKPNGYQSLHTTVIGRAGIPFEIQIRTTEMHKMAEYGVAAHWKYKQGLDKKGNEEAFAWIRQLLEAQQDTEAEDFIKNIKVDLFADEVFVFTPKGDVVALPTGATVLDFAYHIHTQVGNKMTGAKVGGRMVSFDYVVHTGEIVEILTSGSPNYGPNRNWIEIAKTTEAKSKIRSWFKKECREENIERGREELEREFKRNNIAITPELLQTSASRQRLDSVDDLYAAIGYGGVSMAKIVQRIKEDQLRNHKEQQAIQAAAENPMESISENNRRSRKKGIIIEGMENCLVKFAQCCNPLPGDPIIGFVTRGFGVSIHKQDCVNVVNNRDDPENKDRWLKATWAGVEDSTYRATIDVIAEDRITIFADITTAIAANHIPLQEMNGHHLKNGNLDLVVTVEIAGVEQLSNVMGRIQKIPGVISVERTGKQ